MLSLPHARFWLIVGWLLILAIFFGSLVSNGPSLPGVHITDKVQHFTGYFLVMIWFSGLYPKRQHWILAAAFLLMGILIEILQGTLTATRQMDVMDVAANATGIAAAFLLARLGLANWARWIESWWTGRGLDPG